MKMIKCLAAAAISPALFALVGCPTSPKPVLKVPPSAQATYVDGGGTLQWAATGEPFQIFWYGLNPCSKSDILSSDGSSDVTCHVAYGGVNGGSYLYDVGKPAKDKFVVRNGEFSMHVGPCTNCLGGPIPTPVGNQELSTSQLGAASGNEVRISCPKPGATTVVDPPTGPTGLKVGDEVAFEYVGQNPPTGENAFTITFTQSNYCANTSSPIQGGYGYCQIALPGTMTYKVDTAKSFQCVTNTKATLTATTP